MNLLREKARALGHHRAQFGGDSSSSSTQNTTNTYSDNRQVNTSTSTNTALANSGNTSNTDSSNRSTTTTINTGDMGAIAAGAGIANAALGSASTNTALVLALADRLFTAQNKALDLNLNMARDLSAGAQSSYSDATTQATGTKNLVMVGMVVVGLAAVIAFSGKH